MMRANAETRNLGPPRMADADAQVEVLCAFCSGMGKDPFGIMSPLATCQVCSGTGRHTLRQPTAPCPFCQGTGVHPGSRNTCTTCGGVGTVEIPEDAVACPCCGGTGQAADDVDYIWPDSPLSCGCCRGKGVISAERVKKVATRKEAPAWKKAWPWFEEA